MGRLTGSLTPARLLMSTPRRARPRAWRNILCGAINAGLEHGLFSLEPDDVDQCVYPFLFPAAEPIEGVAHVRAIDRVTHSAGWRRVHPAQSSHTHLTAGSARGSPPGSATETIGSAAAQTGCQAALASRLTLDRLLGPVVPASRSELADLDVPERPTLLELMAATIPGRLGAPGWWGRFRLRAFRCQLRLRPQLPQPARADHGRRSGLDNRRDHFDADFPRPSRLALGRGQEIFRRP
jgi:hypothetical protein